MSGKVCKTEGNNATTLSPHLHSHIQNNTFSEGGKKALGKLVRPTVTLKHVLKYKLNQAKQWKM